MGTVFSESTTVAKAMEAVAQVVAELRDPQTGCPWDLKQTHASLKPYLLEEAHETMDAIDDLDSDTGNRQYQAALCDELGDVLLQVLLHSQLASERGEFSLADVATNLKEKLVRRHPHVFGEQSTVDTPEAVNQQWDAIKAAEKKEDGVSAEPESILSAVPKSLPALMRATKLSKKAVKVGFAWPNDDSLWACVMSEIDEFKAETLPETPSPSRLEDELGDILFALSSLANHYGVDSETALARANTKFTNRFMAMEQQATKPLKQLSFEEWDQLWRAAKKATNR